MDRTGEFHRLISVLADGKPAKVAERVSARSVSRFLSTCAGCQSSLEEVQSLTERLEKLAGKKGLYGDPTKEIGELTTLVKRDLLGLTEQLNKLVDMSAREEGTGRSLNGQWKAHRVHIVQRLQKGMRRCTRAFQSALQLRAETLKQQASRRSHFSHGSASPLVQLRAPRRRAPAPSPLARAVPSSVSSSPSPVKAAPAAAGGAPAAAGGKVDLDALPRPGLRQRGGGGPASMDGAATAASMYESMQRAGSRAREVAAVESSLVEIQGMFSRMADVVAEQGELVEHIGDNMEAASGHVSDAQRELLRLLNSMKGDRGLILKLFALLIALVVLLMWIM